MCLKTTFMVWNSYKCFNLVFADYFRKRRCFESTSEKDEIWCTSYIKGISVLFLICSFFNLIKFRSFDPLPSIANKGSNETPYKGEIWWPFYRVWKQCYAEAYVLWLAKNSCDWTGISLDLWVANVWADRRSNFN